jgi:hypothetical protein
MCRRPDLHKTKNNYKAIVVSNVCDVGLNFEGKQYKLQVLVNKVLRNTSGLKGEDAIGEQ